MDKNIKKPAPWGCFWNDKEDKLYMIRCPKCKHENWAPSVASGICSWCGWDVNKGKYFSDKSNEL